MCTIILVYKNIVIAFVILTFIEREKESIKKIRINRNRQLEKANRFRNFFSIQALILKKEKASILI
jgi:hypothetical protein